MALKVELKPHERIIIGETLITNGETRTQLMIEGQSPILREKDVLTKETANSPAKLIYFTVQMMYLDKSVDAYEEKYIPLVQDFLKAVPSSAEIVNQINHQILTGQLYKALREAKQLVAYEEEILKHA